MWPRIKDEVFYDILSYHNWKTGREVVDSLVPILKKRINYGTVYLRMNKLEEKGLVEHLEDSDNSGKLRKFKKVLGKDLERKKEPTTRLFLRPSPAFG